MAGRHLRGLDADEDLFDLIDESWETDTDTNAEPRVRDGPARRIYGDSFVKRERDCIRGCKCGALGAKPCEFFWLETLA
jgi:hypothetical protein